ncbi:14912_t:CDS:2, partial [Rhizophagus irregularis]
IFLKQTLEPDKRQHIEQELFKIEAEQKDFPIAIIYEDHIQASALFGIRLINTGVRNENDPAFALLSESKKRPIFKKVRL